MHLWAAGGPPTGSLYAYGWDLTHPCSLNWGGSALLVMVSHPPAS